jgi:hypothetical protein
MDGSYAVEKEEYGALREKPERNRGKQMPIRGKKKMRLHGKSTSQTEAGLRSKESESQEGKITR